MSWDERTRGRSRPYVAPATPEAVHTACVMFHVVPLPEPSRPARVRVEGETWADVESWYAARFAEFAGPQAETQARKSKLMRLRWVREAARRARAAR